uniref:Uncharacterized protein n=1 Tax=Stomoxys calcitrans TaxID=35570 RepID=A0A1I8PWX8_STOCA
MLVLGKIDYGLFLFGNSLKSSLRQINSLYNNCIRSSIYAFRTTPIKTLLIESGLPSLEEKFLDSKNRILPKILFFNDSITEVSKVLTAKRKPRLTSVIHDRVKNNVLNFSEKLPKYRLKYPVWMYPEHSCNLSLADFVKNNTANETFTQLVPRHVDLTGNLNAASAAKYGCSAPLMTDTLIERIDLKRTITVELQHYHYSVINSSNETPVYPTNIDKKKIGFLAVLGWAIPMQRIDTC